MAGNTELSIYKASQAQSAQDAFRGIQFQVAGSTANLFDRKATAMAMVLINCTKLATNQSINSLIARLAIVIGKLVQLWTMVYPVLAL